MIASKKVLQDCIYVGINKQAIKIKYYF